MRASWEKTRLPLTNDFSIRASKANNYNSGLLRKGTTARLFLCINTPPGPSALAFCSVLKLSGSIRATCKAVIVQTVSHKQPSLVQEKLLPTKTRHSSHSSVSPPLNRKTSCLINRSSWRRIHAHAQQPLSGHVPSLPAPKYHSLIVPRCS